MAFRRKTNRHEAWHRTRKRHRKTLLNVGVPDEVFEAESLFTDFLTKGRDPDTEFSLDRMDNEDFWRLFDFVTSHFDFAATEFAAFEKRRISGPGTS